MHTFLYLYEYFHKIHAVEVGLCVCVCVCVRRWGRVVGPRALFLLGKHSTTGVMLLVLFFLVCFQIVWFGLEL
jgi:hypothetical protein